MTRWQRYWFADGGRTSVAVLRVAIAVAVLLALREMTRSWPTTAPGGMGAAAVYRPVGLWMLVGNAAPSPAVVEALWLLARVTTFAMLFGVCARVATAASFVSSVALASLYYSGEPSWSHQFNVVFLAQLALLGARSGDALSIDALIRRLRGLPSIDAGRGYQWSVRLVQLAVAVMFASGMVHKVWHTYPTLRWALSDNLRHQLLVRFDLAGLERTALANWLLADVWRYRTAALGNLIAQTLPLVACFLMRRPLLRAACGACFALETLGLGLVMELWNWSWLPLAAAFVDWDALIAKLRRREAPPPPTPAGWRPPRHVRAFVVAFVIYHLVTAFKPRLDQRLNTYPFSGFPMFASIRARKPYDRHLPYSLAGGHFEIVSREPPPSHVPAWVDHAYRKVFTVRNREELQRRMTIVLADVRYWVPDVEGLRLHYTIFEVPAYPAPAAFQRRPIALIGELYSDGRFRSMLGEEVGTDVAIEHYVDDRGEPTSVQPGGAGWRSRRPPGKKIAFVAVVREGDREQRWLLATAPR